MRIDRKSLASLGLAVLSFAALTGFAVAIYGGIVQKDRLESRNDAERTLNHLFAGLRDYDDFGAAIEGLPRLREKVSGVAAYDYDGVRIYAWGSAAPDYPQTVSVDRDGSERSSGEIVSRYVEKPKTDSVLLVISPFRGGPPLPPPTEGRTTEGRTSEGRISEGRTTEGRTSDREKPLATGSFFQTLRKVDLVYLEIRQGEYWRRRRVAAVLFPLAEAALAALVLFVRALIVRNAEYRRKIEEQKNLVVLGTAASTLAHEIKNPLLSIKLQARILERTCPESARRELDIIDDEVERLSALSHRVGDYLRDPAGNPRSVDPAEIAADVGARLCGRDIVSASAGAAICVRVDPERLRSILENLVRNALESGGREEDVSVEIAEDGDLVRVDVLDRGSGLDPGAGEAVFDPFFTTKSRGTGIGLAVCRRFAVAAGGSIALGPREGGGCAARLSLPAERPA